MKKIAMTLLGGLSLGVIATPAVAQDKVKVESAPLAVTHIKVHTTKKYADVRAAIESSLASFDAPMRQLLKDGKIEELRAAAAKGAGKFGLMIHYTAYHGDLLMLNGGKKNLIAYYIGNILSATSMTAINPAAGLYAPLRMVVYEDASGGTTIEYDKPSTMFGQFRNPEIDKVAKSLDARILNLARTVSE
ncbi:MAG: DUF302 domain-containing protein [Sphingomonas sp.]